MNAKYLAATICGLSRNRPPQALKNNQGHSKDILWKWAHKMHRKADVHIVVVITSQLMMALRLGMGYVKCVFLIHYE